MTLLDEWMPSYDVAARYSIDVDADTGRAYEVARTTHLGGPWLVKVLMGLRAIPAVAERLLPRGRRGSLGRHNHSRQVGGIPFTALADEPGREFLAGLAGQFWKPVGGIIVSTPETFKAPPVPGLAHALWNFHVEARPGGCRVSTETRVRCADDETRRQFMRYWRVIRVGSGLMRWSMLRQIRRQAERC